MTPSSERRKKMLEEISATLKALRERFGFTQEQISTILGVDRSSYSYIESGKIMPSMEALLVFSKMYSLPVDELLGRETAHDRTNGAKDRFALTKEEKSLLLRYRIEPARKQKELIALLSELCGSKPEK